MNVTSGDCERMRKPSAMIGEKVRLAKVQLCCKD
jgi:hypothetical protein